MSENSGFVGVSDHGGWAILVTAARDGTLLDRRRVELVDETLPGLPHHHDGQMIPIDAAVALVERVRISAEKHSALALDALAKSVPPVVGIALRICPPLPATIAERIQNYRARNLADWVMYRTALASAAETRGWAVYWYDSKNVLQLASRALNVKNFDAYFAEARNVHGPPWNKDHKLALAAAVAAANGLLVLPDL
jgi:hypothetical protein